MRTLLLAAGLLVFAVCAPYVAISLALTRHGWSALALAAAAVGSLVLAVALVVVRFGGPPDDPAASD